MMSFSKSGLLSVVSLIALASLSLVHARPAENDPTFGRFEVTETGLWIPSYDEVASGPRPFNSNPSSMRPQNWQTQNVFDVSSVDPSDLTFNILEFSGSNMPPDFGSNGLPDFGSDMPTNSAPTIVDDNNPNGMIGSPPLVYDPNSNDVTGSLPPRFNRPAKFWICVPHRPNSLLLHAQDKLCLNSGL